LKKKAPIEPLPEDEEYFSQYVSDSDTERELENHELLSVIKTLVSRLSPKQRIVFTLVHLENLDTEEVEQITGMDAAKIKSNLYVARKTIREQLKQLGYGKDG
jgi:RNA polymerase sigma-70 factor (ECF subfamily)